MKHLDEYVTCPASDTHPALAIAEFIQIVLMRSDFGGSRVGLVQFDIQVKGMHEYKRQLAHATQVVQS